MANINTLVLVGRLARDIELSYTANGMAIASGTIAFDRQVKKNGDYVKESNFLDFSIFGKLGENLSPYLTKGKQIAAGGFIKQDRWQDKTTGENRSKISAVFEDIQFVGGRNDNQGAGSNEDALQDDIAF